MAPSIPTPAAPALSFSSQTVASGKIARFSTNQSVITSAALTKPITQELTLEGWVKPTSSATTDTLATLTAGSVSLTLSNPADLTLSLGTSTISTGIALGTGSWRHLAIALKPATEGKFAVWVVVDNALMYQAGAVLSTPAGWPASSQTLVLGKFGSGTALQGDYSEFRLWSTAVPAGLIQTRYFNRIAAGAPNLSMVWSMKTLPANSTKADVTFPVGDLTYFTDMLSAQWTVEADTTYTLYASALDYVWGEIYPNLAENNQTITDYWLNHGIEAKLQATKAEQKSAFSPITTRALFRLGLPHITLDASVVSKVAKLSLQWGAVDQAEKYVLTFQKNGQQPTSSSQSTLIKDISSLLLGAKSTTITVGSKTGIVQSLPATATALTTPTPTLSYDVSNPDNPGDITLKWTAVEGAEKYLISWTVENGTAKDPEYVDGSVTSLPPFQPTETNNVTYMAKVQALSVGGVSATGSAQVVVSNITAPTTLSAVTTPTAGQTAGSILLTWNYTGATTSGVGFEVEIDNKSGDKVVSTDSSIKSHLFTNTVFTTDQWFTGKIRYKAGNVTGPWASMIIFIIPQPYDFNASINSAGDVITAAFKSSIPPTLAEKGTSLEYTVHIVGPISGSDCTQIPPLPLLNVTLGPFTGSPHSWNVSSIAGYDHLKAYSSTVTAVVKNNGSKTIASACDTLEKYVPISSDPDQDPTNDPIGVASGNLIYFDTDIQLDAVFPLNFILFYNSGFPTHAENANIEDSDLGERWRHGFETCLVKDSGNKKIYIISGSTDITVYKDTANSHGLFQSISPYKGDTLSQGQGGSYILQQRDQTSWVFNTSGQATSALDKYGNQLDLTYTSGKLHQVKLKGGTPALNFAYDGNGKIKTITGSNGLVLSLTVISNQLKTVQIPAIGTRSYSYATTGISLLQQVTDPWGNITVYNEYDANGRVSKQYDAMGYGANPKYYTHLVYGTTTYKGQTVNTTSVTQPQGDITLYYSDPDSTAIVYQETALGNNPAGQPVYEIVTTAYTGFMQPYQVRVFRGPKADYNYDKANVTTYSYDTNMNVVSLMDPAGRPLTWTYDGNNNLIHETDLWGNQKSYSYYTGNRLHVITDAMGQTVTYDYWSGLAFEGLIKTVTDPYGNQSTLSYHTDSGMVNVLTHADQTTDTITYDSSGRPHTEQKSEANATSVSLITRSHDNLGRVIIFDVQMSNQSAANAYHYSWQYDTPTPNHILETFPDGSTLTSLLNANRVITTETYSEFEGVSVHRSFGYDKNNRLESLTLGSKAPTRYGYNGLNEITSITDPLGHVESFFQQQVDTAGTGPYSNELIITKPKLSQYNPVTSKNEEYYYTQTQTFDSSGLKSQRLLSFYPIATPTQPLWSQKQTWHYTAAEVQGGNSPYIAITESQTLSPLEPAGAAVTRSVTFNGLYRITKYTNADNKSATTGYEKIADPAGTGLQVMKITNTPQVGAAKNSFIDPQGRLLAKSSGTDTEARASLFQRDAIGRLTRIRTGDTLENLKAGTLTAPGAGQVDVTYHFVPEEKKLYADIGQTTSSSTTPAPLNQTIKFDSQNNITEEVFTTGGTIALEYSPWGSVSKRSLASGGNLSFGFDDAGFLLTVTPGTETQVSHVLDDSGNRTSTKIGENVAIVREFDSWNRLSQRTESGTTIKQTQWPNGALRNLTYPDGKSVSYTLNGLGKLATVKDWANRSTSYKYWPSGLLKNVTYPNDVVESYGFNDAGSPNKYTLSGKNNIVISDLTITPNQHNETGEISGIWSMPTKLPEQTETLTYTQNILETYQGQSISSNEDKSITQIPQSGTLIDVGYDSIGRLSTVGDIRYVYDADGFRTSRTEATKTTTYTIAPNGYHDPLMNMGSLRRETYHAENEPTALGGRMMAPVYGQNQDPDPAHALDWLIEYADTPSKINKVVNGIGPLYEEKSDNSLNFFHGDPFGNIIATTNNSGDVVTSTNYSSFGTAHSDNPMGRLPFGYAGKFGVMDDGSGLLAMRARAYSPNLMRFTSRDLLIGNVDNPTSLNRFQYGLNNPYLYADPLGLNPLPKIIGGILGGLAGIAIIGVAAAAAGGVFSEGGALAGVGAAVRGLASNILRAVERRVFRWIGRELGRDLLERELWAGEEVELENLIQGRVVEPEGNFGEGVRQRLIH